MNGYFFRLLLIAFCCTEVAYAQTTISADLAGNVTWSLSGSPYLVSGSLNLPYGSSLTIEPNVVVYMASGAELHVRGLLKAQGTEALPIRVLSDKTRQGALAAPGDWGQWIFESTSSAQTRLDYVVFEHGRGLSVLGSAPTLNFLNIKNNAAPAMTIDLAASPTGAGNQATGNQLNAIVVPQGDITGTVKWGVRGIPYLLSGAGVGVGVAPVISNVTPLTVEQGETALLHAVGSRLAGLAEVKLPSAGLSGDVQSGASNTSADIALLVPSNTAPGAYALTALTDAGRVDLAAAITISPMQAPTIGSMTPRAVNRDSETNVLLTGTSLSVATVSSVTPGISILSQVPSKSALSFRVGVAAGVVAGKYTLSLANQVGSLPFDLEVIPERGAQTDFQLIPSLIVLPVDVVNYRKFVLRAPQTSTVERRFSLVVADTSVAVASASEAVLAAGQYEVAVLIKGLRVEKTQLTITGGGMSVPLEVPVAVSSTPFSTFQISNAVGVSKGLGRNSGSNFQQSAIVGVQKGALISNSGKYSGISPSVGVFKTGLAWSTGGTYVSPRVGIARTAQ